MTQDGREGCMTLRGGGGSVMSHGGEGRKGHTHAGWGREGRVGTWTRRQGQQAEARIWESEVINIYINKK